MKKQSFCKLKKMLKSHRSVCIFNLCAVLITTSSSTALTNNVELNGSGLLLLSTRVGFLAQFRQLNATPSPQQMRRSAGSSRERIIVPGLPAGDVFATDPFIHSPVIELCCTCLSHFITWREICLLSRAEAPLTVLSVLKVVWKTARAQSAVNLRVWM